MGLFSGKQKKETRQGFFSKGSQRVGKPEFDKEREYPVVRCSICNGEQVAGFKDRSTGHFREYSLIRSAQELEEFRMLCGVEQVPKEY